ncbi:hypothetical protein F503_01771 [Ophiostoma piceae UAMH 11346]|uniref:Uncharacterized protein n=1 Tax=Ophiostoma piceae (strain UAMH 11346) TaxID=1262450 RepID=S3BWS0_OPHP1|nr:hypothetical protein F503_01771 [Ophiostoma piceae UAMH 11346]
MHFRSHKSNQNGEYTLCHRLLWSPTSYNSAHGLAIRCLSFITSRSTPFSHSHAAIMTTMTTTLTTTSTSTSTASYTMTTSMSFEASDTASWQEVGYRCPRPGFFLGDDGSMASSHILHADPNTSSSSQKLSPSWSLGALGKLPLELLHQIISELGEMDIRALVALRNCNRGIASIVDSFRDFAVVSSFPRALGALVKLAPSRDVSSGPSLSALAACLRTTACASCHGDSYGDYIYLLRPERVCYSCFRSKPEYLPVARFAGPSSSSNAQHTSDNTTSIRVPPGRYGVLARLTQPADLFDRRQVEAQASSSDVQPLPAPTRAKHASKPRPDPLRYAAVIPGPYWQFSSSTKIEDGELDRGFSCRACCQTDRKSAGHAGWADPLARYTAQGLERHVADPLFGGRVIHTKDSRTGADMFEHDAPRRGHFPPPVEFGATADLARRYEAVILVPEGSVVGTRL